MANPNLQIEFTPTNMIIGVVCVVIALALFTWLLPLIVGPQLALTVAGAAVGVLVWFLYAVSRKKAE